MTHVFHATELEGVATFWRILRRDGVTLGFTAHDRDLWFDGVLHRAAPGMVPAAIQRSAGFEPDAAEVEGALSHDTIAERDLEEGRFDGALVAIGVVDWETLEREVFYHGTIGDVALDGAAYSASLQSAKHRLAADPVPRTSPTCRAQFCGPGCGLSPARHEVRTTLTGMAEDGSAVGVGIGDPRAFVGGRLRWLDGPQAGMDANIMAVEDRWLVLDRAADEATPAGTAMRLREGCDHTIATCHERFANAANFRGEPFLPGNDVLSRYPGGNG